MSVNYADLLLDSALEYKLKESHKRETYWKEQYHDFVGRACDKKQELDNVIENLRSQLKIEIDANDRLRAALKHKTLDLSQKPEFDVDVKVTVTPR